MPPRHHTVTGRGIAHRPEGPVFGPDLALAKSSPYVAVEGWTEPPWTLSLQRRVAAPMSTDVRTQIHEYVEELAKQDDIDSSVNLFEAGLLTSVHVLDLIACLEESFEISIDPDDLSVDNFASIDAMVTFTEKAMQRAA